MLNKVYTYGVFDLFHYGHLRAIKRAKKYGEKLYIGVFSDKTAESFKRKPITCQEDRVKLIEELDLGEVLLLNNLEPTQEELDRLGITVVVKAEGAGWTKERQPEWNGIKSILINYTEGISSSEIIKRCRIC